MKNMVLDSVTKVLALITAAAFAALMLSYAFQGAAYYKLLLVCLSLAVSLLLPQKKGGRAR